MSEWFTYTVFDDRLMGCTTYDKDGNPVKHNHGFVCVSDRPKTDLELSETLRMLLEKRDAAIWEMRLMRRKSTCARLKSDIPQCFKDPKLVRMALDFVSDMDPSDPMGI